MSAHVPEELLTDFVMGEVDEQLAIHVAEHLDACPRCATRAAHLEPLATAFAAVDDPLVPDDLIDDVLAAVAADERRRLPALEVAVGAALLLAAIVLVAMGSDPIGLLTDTLTTVPRLGRLVTQGSATLLGLCGALALFVFSSTLAVRRSLRRSSS